MEIDKKTYLITGTKNVKTKEKIRLKLRLALNNHKRCLIGITPLTDISRSAFYFGKDGYKHLMLIYKSASKDNVFHFLELFQSMYRNEVDLVPIDETSKPKKEVGPYALYLVSKTRKKVF